VVFFLGVLSTQVPLPPADGPPLFDASYCQGSGFLAPAPGLTASSFSLAFFGHIGWDPGGGKGFGRGFFESGTLCSAAMRRASVLRGGKFSLCFPGWDHVAGGGRFCRV